MTTGEYNELVDSIDHTRFPKVQCESFEGLKIIGKYCTDGELVTYACHDKIYSVDWGNFISKNPSKYDIEKLAALGWFIDSENGALTNYV